MPFSCPFTTTINIRRNVAIWEMTYKAKVIFCVLQHVFLQKPFREPGRLTIIHNGHSWTKAKNQRPSVKMPSFVNIFPLAMRGTKNRNIRRGK